MTVYVLYWTDCSGIYLVTTDKERVHRACAENPTLEWSEQPVEGPQR